MQFGLVLHPPVRHHSHQVEADVVVRLPAGRAAALSHRIMVTALSPPPAWAFNTKASPQNQEILTVADEAVQGSATTQNTLEVAGWLRWEEIYESHLLQALLQQYHPELVTRIASRQILNISRDGDPTTSLGNLC